MRSKFICALPIIRAVCGNQVRDRDAGSRAPCRARMQTAHCTPRCPISVSSRHCDTQAEQAAPFPAQAPSGRRRRAGLSRCRVGARRSTSGAEATPKGLPTSSATDSAIYSWGGRGIGELELLPAARQHFPPFLRNRWRRSSCFCRCALTRTNAGYHPPTSMASPRQIANLSWNLFKRCAEGKKGRQS